MTDTRRRFALAARAAISEFYRDPENLREFEEWKQSREAGAQTATNETRATPTERPATGAATA